MDNLKRSGLIIFLRAPVQGTVKTRLAATLGDFDTLVIYRKLMEMTLTLAATSNMTVYIFYDGPLSVIPTQTSFNYINQISGDLGERMQHAFEYVLQYHDKSIIIGSDCPYITHNDLSEAEGMLDKYDCVIGPADDGGYYLLGCKKVNPAFFQSIPWSTETVLEETIRRIKKTTMTYYLLRTLQDIDSAEDWYTYQDNKDRHGNLSAPE